MLRLIPERFDGLRPFVQIGLWLGVAFSIVSASLSAFSATPVLKWLPKTVTGTGYLEDNRQRVARAEQEYDDGRADRQDHLGAIVGISNVRQGIDLAVIDGAAGRGWRFIGLGGAGLGMPDIAKHADVLLESDLRPDLVVIGLDVHQLLDSRPKPATLQTGFLDYLRQGDLRNTAIAARDAVWVYTRRQDVAIVTEGAALDARDWLFRKTHTRLVDAAPDGRSPWRDMLKSDWPEHFSAKTLKEEEEFFEGLGAFELATYRDSEAATRTLVRVIQGFRARGARVVLVLMPEHSTLQKRIPAESFAIVTRRFSEAFGLEIPPMLDFRQAVGDDGFVNLAHLNKKGTAAFSRLVAEKVRAYLPSGPSRMGSGH